MLSLIHYRDSRFKVLELHQDLTTLMVSMVMTSMVAVRDGTDKLPTNVKSLSVISG